MKTFNEKDLMEVDPLYNQDVRSLKRVGDKLVITRVDHICAMCHNDIKKKEPARCVSESFGERKIKSFYFCNECCYAMSEFWNDGGKAWDERILVGRKKAAENPQAVSRKTVLRFG